MDGQGLKSISVVKGEGGPFAGQRAHLSTQCEQQRERQRENGYHRNHVCPFFFFFWSFALMFPDIITQRPFALGVLDVDNRRGWDVGEQPPITRLRE